MSVPERAGTCAASEMMMGSVSSRVMPFGAAVVVVILVTGWMRVSVWAATVTAKMLSAKLAASTRESILLTNIEGELLSPYKNSGLAFLDCFKIAAGTA